MCGTTRRRRTRHPREQRGKWAYYRIIDDALTSLAAAINSAG
jgi:hypothetical protein